MGKRITFRTMLRWLLTLLVLALVLVLALLPEVKGAAHPEAARLWLSFIRSPKALSIFERYGFKPFTTAASAG